MDTPFDTKIESEIYSQFAAFIDGITKKYPIESVKWRGLGGVMILRSFLETSMKSEMDDAHEIMKAYDVMSDHVFEIFQNSTCQSDESAELSESPGTSVSESGIVSTKSL